MQFRSVRNVILVILVFLSPMIAVGQDSWNFPDFSATEVLQSRRGSMSMKVYSTGSSVRVERSEALSTLYVPSASKVYNLTTYPDHSHQCVVMKPEQAKMLPSPLELLQGSDLKRTFVGRQELDGRSCRVETITVTRPDGSKIESKVWEAQDLQGIPVRIESHIDDVILSADYKDIQMGPPDHSLFEIPEKCTPFEKMGQVVEEKTIQ